MQPLEDNRIKLIQFRYFYDRWLELYKQCRTQRQAYDEVEGEFVSFFGYRRYSSFESFYIVANRKLKK